MRLLMSSTAFIVIHRMTRNLFGDFLLKRLLTDFRGGDLFGRCRYPLGSEKVPQISQIYTDFSWDVFLSRRFRRWRSFFYSSDDTEFIRRFLAETITHGFSQRRPVRSLQIPLGIGKSPTDFTDLHRFFLGRFFKSRRFRRWRRFFSSDDTEFIRRFLAEAITHGISRRRPVRSLQIPPEIGQSPTDFTDLHRFFHHRMTRNLFGDFLLRRLLTEFRGGDLFGRCRYPLRSDKAIHLRFKKICVYLWNLWDKNNHTKKNLRHLRNLRDQKQSSTYRAPAIGQRPNICENPWVIR